MLTPREHKVLQFIRRHIDEHGYAPSLEEIGAAIGVRSRGSVHRYVSRLEDKGYLRREPHGARALELLATPEGPPFGELPLLGRIAAGRPIEAIPGQDTLNLADFLLGADRFALQVVGDSMVEAGILDGDTVVVRRQDRAEDGNIVVALIDQQEATLKRLKHCGRGMIELIPANAGMSAMVYSADRVTIQGVVVGQLRSYR